MIIVPLLGLIIT